MTDAGADTDLDRRAGWLAAGLRVDGFDPAGVAVLCCAEHAADRGVACRTGELLGVPVTVVEPDDWTAEAIKAAGADLTLACSHGTAAWRRSGAAGRVVGEGVGARWWRLVELDGRRAVAAC